MLKSLHNDNMSIKYKKTNNDVMFRKYFSLWKFLWYLLFDCVYSILYTPHDNQVYNNK